MVLPALLGRWEAQQSYVPWENPYTPACPHCPAGYYYVETYPSKTDLGTYDDWRTFQSARRPMAAGFPVQAPMQQAVFM